LKEKLGKKYFKLGSIITCITLSILTIIPGYFFTNNLLFPISILTFIVLFLLANWEDNRILGIILSTIMISALVYTFTIGFEENYCWAKGDEAQAKAIKEGINPYSGPLTETDKEQGYTQVSVAYRAHMDCHKNFNLEDAIRIKYSFISPTLENQLNSPGNPYGY
jgi:hypothetical protein